MAITSTQAGTPAQASLSFRIAIWLWIAAAIVVVAGFIWIGPPDAAQASGAGFIPVAFAALLAGFGVLHAARGALLRMRLRKYGDSRLEAGVATLGEVFRGKVRTERDVVVTGPFRLRLVCERRRPSDDEDGGSRGVTTPLWESEVLAPPSTRSVAGVPFAISIPANGLPSTNAGADGDTITWTLHVSAPMSGLDYRVSFPIEVADGAGARGVASAPFEGYARPEPPWTRIARFLAPGLGALLLAAGLYATANQWGHGRDGVMLTGRIVSAERPGVEVALDRGGVARLRYVTKYTRWQPGQPVSVVCLAEEAAWRSCRMDTNGDRWIDALGTLAVGAALLAFGAWLWARRRRR